MRQEKVMIDISIIIVGTNEKDFVSKCLGSIFSSNTKYSLETIFVDNASADGTFEMVKERFSGVKVILNNTKKGYIYSNNIAIKAARGRYILILNADIELKADTLQFMVDFMDSNPDVAVSGCRLVFDDGVLQLTCRRFPTPLIYFSRLPHFFRWIKSAKKLANSNVTRRYLMLDYDHKKTREVDWLLSACFMMRKSVIDRIGAFDNKLVPPFYLEDVDWCFRARLAGYKVVYVPEVYAVHYYKRGSVKKFNWLSVVHMLNIMIFFAKHGVPMLLKMHRRKINL